MGYWRYKAFDEQTRITEGILESKYDDEQMMIADVLSQLYGQNLSGIELMHAERHEYLTEQRILKLRSRMHRRVGRQLQQKPRKGPIRRILTRIAALFG